MRGTRSNKPIPKKELEAYLEDIREQRQRYFREYGLTHDDLWVLIDGRIHQAMLDTFPRVSEGPDRITKQCILGMHAIHDYVKKIWVVPKHRPEKEEDRYSSHKRFKQEEINK